MNDERRFGTAQPCSNNNHKMVPVDGKYERCRVCGIQRPYQR